MYEREGNLCIIIESLADSQIQKVSPIVSQSTVRELSENQAYELLKILHAWKEQADKLSSEEISREEYDKWRYNYPKYDKAFGYVKVPSQQFSNTMVEAFKDMVKND